MKKILIVVHQATSDPGLVGQILQANGCHLDIRCPALEQALPETMADHDGAIVFGGPMSANDDATLPFIRTELDWIPTVLAANKPYLGICLGAQLLARVLGGTVAPHPQGVREIGYAALQATAAGQAEMPHLTQVYHWHKEGFTVPASATLLATGEVFANQAFRYGDRTYAVQFHPEITAELIRAWIQRAGKDVCHPGAQDPQTQFNYHAQYGITVERWLTQFLDRWLNFRGGNLLAS